MSVVEAGRKGGLAVLRKKGYEYFRQIGKNGQRATRRKHPGMAREWGRLGGRPRKDSPNREGEVSKKE
jgi:hypothetical protein